MLSTILARHTRENMGRPAPQTYSAYRPWLRDEFTFRCVYCLARADTPDPCTTLTAEHVRVKADGTIKGLTREARKMIRLLALDSEACNRWRRIWRELPETY